MKQVYFLVALFIGASFSTNAQNTVNVDASAEIWKFFSRYDINGLIITTNMDHIEENDRVLMVYPNPATNYIMLKNSTGVR